MGFPDRNQNLAQSAKATSPLKMEKLSPRPHNCRGHPKPRSGGRKGNDLPNLQARGIAMNQRFV